MISKKNKINKEIKLNTLYQDNLKKRLDDHLNNLNNKNDLNYLNESKNNKKIDNNLNNLKSKILINKELNTNNFNLYYFITSLLFFIILMFITPYLYQLILNITNSLNINKDQSKKKIYKRQKKETSNLSIIYSKSIIIIIYIIFFSIIIKLSGLKSTVLVAFVGSLGATIALAAQGALNNFISGILISTQNIYNVGEYIEINDIPGNGLNNKLLGQVTNFDFFTTIIRENYTNIIKSINNKVIWNSTISNYNRSSAPRYFFSIFIAQNNDLDKIINIIKNICLNSPHVFHPNFTKEDNYRNDLIEEEADLDFNYRLTKRNVHITFENQDSGFCSLKIVIGVKINPKHFPKNISELRKDIILELTKNNININCLINIPKNKLN